MKHLSRRARPFLPKLSCFALLALSACGEDSSGQSGSLDANTSVGGDASTADAAQSDGGAGGAQPNGPSDTGALADAVANGAVVDATIDAVLAPTKIDFEMVEGVTPGGINGAVAAESRLSNQLQARYGVSFASISEDIPAIDKPYVALVKLGEGHATSGVNGIGSVSASDTVAYSTMIIMFTMPANPSTAAVTNQVSIRGDQNASVGKASIEAFDVNRVSLGKETYNDIAGGLTMFIARPNIHSIILRQDSRTIAFDDLAFNPLMPAPAP